MSDLREWLRGHHLEQYADAFEAHDVDLDILPDLNEGDLERLGLSLGNRRRLLKAIAGLAASEPGSVSSSSAESSAVDSSSASSSSAHSSSSDGSGSLDAERRQVTVMFADMVGSTALSAKVDPELLGGLIRRYQDAVAGAIGRYGGFVAKFMGDGVLAYFGFPRAYEDAAERAVRAAIGILSEVGEIELPDDTPVQARIGIATGLVVVGEIIGIGPAQERTIVGETPNLAARLQALAGPDCILVSEATQKLLGGLFELTHAGDHDLKGFARPVPVWQVCGEASVESRFAAIRTGRSLPLIGRAHEMGLIGQRWQLAREGEGQIVTVTGEPGIGKSRTIEALQQELAAEPHARVNLQCSPYHSDSALYPVIQYLNRAARFTPTDATDARIEKLRSWLEKRNIADASALPLLAELLSIPLPAEAPSGLTPAQRKASTLALLVNMLIGLSKDDPVLVVLEDAHWIDATTLDMMMRLTDSIGDARLLAVVTARPEFAAPWLARPQATLVSLGRLGRPECMQVIAGVAMAHGLPAATVAAIVAKTDGVPLFIEELTKTVMESAGDTAVPATLKDSLMARLDRLGGARDVAQIAAVIGRQFTFSLLEAVAGKNAGELDSMLAKLVAAGIVFPEERGLERSFIFKHALLRDAAYESLLLIRRREWHERVAHALERSFGDVAAKEPELLAFHFGEAGLLASACDYRMRAGDLAVSRSAYPEAIAHFSAGLKLAERMPPQDGMRLQLEFWLKLGSASVVAHGLQSAEAEKAYTRASEIGEKLGDGPKSFQAKWGLWINANLRRKTALARSRAIELVALARQSGDGELLLEAYHCQLSTAHFRGDVHGALDGCHNAIALYDMAQHRHLGHAFGGHDPGVCAHAQCGNSWQLSGDAESARQHFTRAITLAEMLDHPNSLGHGLHNIGIGHQLGGDREATYRAAHRAAALADKFGLPPWRASSLVLVGWATATGAGVADAVRLIDAEIANATAVGPLPQYYLGLAAEVLLAAGRPADALAHLDRAIAGIDEPGIGIYLPEIYRLRGACLLALDRNNKDEVRSAFATAVEIAKRQGAVIFERRAQASFSELARSPASR